MIRIIPVHRCAHDSPDPRSVYHAAQEILSSLFSGVLLILTGWAMPDIKADDQGSVGQDFFLRT